MASRGGHASVAASRRRSAWSSSRPCIRRVSSCKNSPRFHGGSTRQRSCTRLRSSSVNCSIASFPCARGATLICRILTVDYASWGNRTGHRFRAVSSHVTDWMAGAVEFEEEFVCAGLAAIVPCGKVRSCTICCHSLRHDSGSRCHGVRFPCKKFYRPHPLIFAQLFRCAAYAGTSIRCRRWPGVGQALAMSADNRRS